MRHTGLEMPPRTPGMHVHAVHVCARDGLRKKALGPVVASAGGGADQSARLNVWCSARALVLTDRTLSGPEVAVAVGFSPELSNGTTLVTTKSRL